MSDIARRLDVSQATVSLVLNDAPGTRISAGMRERVLAVARELGYVKALPARRVSEGAIGLILDDVTASRHAAPLIEGVRSQAAANGYTVLMTVAGGDADDAGAALDQLAQRPLAGIIYATLVTQAMPAPPPRLAGFPVVLLNCYQPRGRYSSVIPGDVAGAFAGTSALIAAGHRRIAMINAGERGLDAVRDRLRGYRQALATHDIPVDPALISIGAWSLELGRAHMHRLLDLPQPPTAVFCFSDRVAMGVYDAVRQRGLTIPGDISVVGFDNESLAAQIAPPLSTLVLPHEDMGRWAVTELLDRVANPRKAPVRLKMECMLILRDSIAPPRTAETCYQER